MFDKLKAMGAMAALFKDKDKLRAAGQRIREKSEAVRAEGEGGAGAVRVTVNGQLKVVAVELTPALVMGMAADERTRELAGDLIAQAVNAANASAQVHMKAIIDREARELGLPGLPEEVSGLLGQ
jgi:DNA-binding protein YbaB